MRAYRNCRGVRAAGDAAGWTAVLRFSFQTRHLRFALIFTRFIARLFARAIAKNTVQSIETRRTSRHTGRTLMDLLNTFFIFNLSATVAVLVGFALIGNSVASTVANVKARVAGFNVAGMAGAASSMALLSTVAVLFR